MYQIPKNPIEQGFLSTIYINRPSIAIIVDNLSSNQIAFEIINEIHLIEKNNTEYVLFSQDWNPPVLLPTVALYHISDIVLYRGNAIATSINSLYDCINHKKLRNILWYSYNPYEIELYQNQGNQIHQLISEKNIKVIARSK